MSCEEIDSVLCLASALHCSLLRFLVFKVILKQISLERNSEGSSLLDVENWDKVMTPSIVTDVDGDWWEVGEQAREPSVSLLETPNSLH